MKKLHISFIREIKNVEFAILVNLLAKSLEGIETQDELLKNTINKIRFHSSEMAFLKDQISSHPLTEVIGTLTRQRTNYLISLRLQVEGKMLSHRIDEREAARNLYRWLESSKKYLYIPSLIPQTGRIMGLMHELETDNAIQESLVFLRLDDLFEAIIEVTNKIAANDKRRMNDKANDTKKGTELRNAAYKDIKLLVQVIEVMMSLHPEHTEDNIYYKLALRIELELKNRHTILKSRNTKRRNKKEVVCAITELISCGKENESESDNNLTVNKCNDLKVMSIVSTDSASHNESRKETSELIDRSSEKENEKDEKWKLPPFDIN